MWRGSSAASCRRATTPRRRPGTRCPRWSSWPRRRGWPSWLRGQDNDDAIRKRTAEAVIEMSHHAEYDYIVVNDHFDQAIEDVKAIIRAERLRTARQVRQRRGLLDALLSRGEPIQ